VELTTSTIDTVAAPSMNQIEEQQIMELYEDYRKYNFKLF
jgi:hypothetical protein